MRRTAGADGTPIMADETTGSTTTEESSVTTETTQQATQQTTQQAGSGSETAQAQQTAASATAEETVSKAEHNREMDRLRNELGQFKKRTKELEDAQKTEGEKLAEKAALADKLGPEVETLRAAIAAEVEERRKALPKEMLELLPEGSAPEQLAWIRKAAAAAEKLKPKGDLPAAGGRNPANPADGAATSIRREQAVEMYPSLQRRKFPS